MSDVLEELVVLITGNAQGLVTAFGEARAAQQEHADASASMMSKMSGAMTAMGIIGAATVGVEMVKSFAEFASGVIKSSMESIEHLTLLSQEFGITTKQMGGLKVVGEEVGMSVEDMGASLRIMQKNLSDAVTGIGLGTVGLQKLGLSAEALKNLKPEDQIKVIATAFQGLNNQTDKAAVATDLFGRNGLAMIPILNKGAEGLDEANAKALQYGIALSNVDSAKVTQTSEAFHDTSLAIEGAGNKLTVALSPYLQTAAKYITNLVGDSKMWGEVFGEAINFAINALDGLYVGWQVIYKAINIVWEAVKIFGLALATVAAVGDKAFRYLYDVLTTFGKYVADECDVMDRTFDMLWDSAKDASIIAFAAIARVVANTFSDIAAGMIKAGIKGSGAFNDAAAAINVSMGSMSGKAQKDLNNISESWESVKQDAASAGKSMSDALSGKNIKPDIMESIVKSLKDSVIKGWDTTLNALQKPISFGNIKTWADNAVKIVTDSANKMAAAMEAGQSRTSTQSNVMQDADLMKYFNRTKQKEAAENKRYADELTHLKGELAKANATTAQSDAILEQAAGVHGKNLADINDSTDAEILNADKVTNKERLADAQSFLSELSSAMSSNNKKMFEVAKAASIANAIISTGEGAIKAFTAMSSIPIVGPALGAIAAAAVIAYGAYQVSNIASTQFGGGGSVGGGTPAIPSASAAATPSASTSATGSTNPTGSTKGTPSGGITVVMQGGGSYTPQQVRGLINQINIQQGNGA